MNWAANWYKRGDIYVNPIDEIGVNVITNNIGVDCQSIDINSSFKRVEIGVNVIESDIEEEINTVDIGL